MKTGQNDKNKGKTRICRNKKEKATQEKITIQLEKINQKLLAKEGWLKNIDKGQNKTDKIGHSKITKEISLR